MICFLMQNFTRRSGHSVFRGLINTVRQVKKKNPNKQQQKNKKTQHVINPNYQSCACKEDRKRASGHTWTLRQSHGQTYTKFPDVVLCKGYANGVLSQGENVRKRCKSFFQFKCNV